MDPAPEWPYCKRKIKYRWLPAGAAFVTEKLPKESKVFVERMVQLATGSATLVVVSR